MGHLVPKYGCKGFGELIPSPALIEIIPRAGFEQKHSNNREDDLRHRIDWSDALIWQAIELFLQGGKVGV